MPNPGRSIKPEMFHTAARITHVLAINQPRRVRMNANPTLLRLSARNARTIDVRVMDRSNLTRRGIPPNTRSAMIYFRVGDDFSPYMEAWSFRATTCAITSITLPEHIPPGTPDWVTTCWQGGRGNQGPRCEMMSVRMMLSQPMIGHGMKCA